MDIKIKEGMKAEIELVVEQQHTAVAFGSGDVEVLATPVMIGLMEHAAMNAVDRNLGEGYATVGTMLNIKHLAATPVGMKAKAEAELIRIEGKRLTFNVAAYDEKEKIGEGTHERYIIEVAKFLKRVQEKIVKK